MKKIKTFLNNPLFSGSAIMIFGSNAVSGLNYLYHLMTGRLLGPESYGELASLISVISLLSILPVSLTLVIIKFVSSSKNIEEVNGLIGWLRIGSIKLSLLIFIVLVIFSQSIATFLKISSNIYIILIGVAFMLSLPTVIFRAALQGLLKFKEYILTILTENVFKLGLTLVLILLGFKVFGAIVALIMSIVIGFILTAFYLRKSYSQDSHPPKDLKKMVMYTIPVIIQSISITSLYSSDLILVKHFFSAFDAGIYAALSTLGKIIFFGTGPIGAVMFPLVSKKLSKGENYEKIFILSFIATLFISIFVLLVYWLIPKFAINLLYGSSYTQAAGLLLWFGIFMTLFTLSTLLINYNLSIGKTRTVIFPLFAAIFQIIFIWFIHDSISIVISISTIITALLLGSLLIYSSYNGNKKSRNTVNISNSTSI